MRNILTMHLDGDGRRDRLADIVVGRLTRELGVEVRPLEVPHDQRVPPLRVEVPRAVLRVQEHLVPPPSDRRLRRACGWHKRVR